MNLIFALMLVSTCLLLAIEKDSPVVSELGRARVKKSIDTLSLHIENIQMNLGIAKDNLKTVSSERSELNQLLKKHIELKNKLSSKLNLSKKNIVKIEVREKELNKWKDSQKRRLASHEKDLLLEDAIEKNRKELIELDRWKKMNLQSIHEIESKLSVIDSQEKKISADEKETLKQSNFWKLQLEDYEKKLAESLNKKKELESLVR